LFIKTMQLKSYKTFFFAFLIIGGFLFWGSVGQKALAANCTCANGKDFTTLTQSAITEYGNLGAACEMYCAASGGAKINDEYINSTDPCGGCNDPGFYCNTSTGRCEYDGSQSYDPTDPEASNLPNSDYDPTSSSNSSQKSSSGGGSASLPNFVGVSSISELILKITKFLIALAIPFAVLMLIWAGFQFATAQGSEEKLRTAKRNLVWTIAGIAVIMASNAIIGYITEILGGGTGEGNALITTIKNVLDQIIGLLFILVTVFFFWGIVEFVRASSSGDTGKLEEGKRHMIWGIIGMAVMAGAWGIVRIIQQAFQ